jgi:Protein of unknown function (DUF1214)
MSPTSERGELGESMTAIDDPADLDPAVASIAAAEWEAFVDALRPLGQKLLPKLQDPGDADARHDLYRMIFSQVANGFLALMAPHPEHPEFYPAWNHAITSMGVNPDTCFAVCPLDGDGTYHISGFRGTVRTLSFNIGGGDIFRDGGGFLGPTLAGHDGDSLALGADGSFEVALSPSRPDGWAGDWWQLDPAATHLLVRQISYDWINEVDARLAIDRLDRPVSRPRQRSADVARSLRQIATWAENWSSTSIWLVDQIRADGHLNSLGVYTHAEQAGIRDDGTGRFQRYLEGIFEMSTDEAWILDVQAPGEAQYWGFQLCDELYADYMGTGDRQTSLNQHTIHVNSDGRARVVLAATDPGVPNWLDTAGDKRVVVVNRWLNTDIGPMPEITRARTADVRSLLPIDTPRVSAEERERTLRQRKVGLQLRRRW